MKIVLAVSGGVDSMLLLRQVVEWARAEGRAEDLVVAQFDHGTRESARADQEFVARVAKELGVKCEVGRVGGGADDVGGADGFLCGARLGEAGLSEARLGLSEAVARAARYEFLEAVARKYAPAEIWTAQHLDDLVETVAINLLRGTGWRGLAAMGRAGVRRPWLEGGWQERVKAEGVLMEGSEGAWAGGAPPERKEIWRAAGELGLVFREDPTNQEEGFLRNRLRPEVAAIERERKLEIWRLWQRQRELRREIDELVAELMPAAGAEWSRSWFFELEPVVAWELLRAGLLRAGVRATRPQLEEFRRAILEYAPGRKFNLPGGKLVQMGRDEFIL